MGFDSGWIRNDQFGASALRNLKWLESVVSFHFRMLKSYLTNICIIHVVLHYYLTILIPSTRWLRFCYATRNYDGRH